MDLIKLDPFPNVPTTGPATLVTSRVAGYSVHAILFELGGTSFTKSNISYVQLKHNGKTLIDRPSGAQLQDINDYDGLSSDAAYLSLFLGDPTARTIRGQHMGDLDLSVYPFPLEIELSISGATAPTLSAYALVGPPKLDMGIGYTAAEAASVRAMIRTSLTISAAVTRQAQQVGLGSAAGARLRRLALFHSNLTSLAFKKSSIDKWDDISVALNNYIEGEFARTSQSGLYMLDRVVDGNQGEAETTIQANGQPWPFQVLMTTSASDTITAFADVHTLPPLL